MFISIVICRFYISKDIKGPQVPVDRSELTLMVETAQSARMKLYKQLEVLFLFIFVPYN